MSGLRVWAPRARQVELAVADQRVPMSANGGGWWETPLPNDEVAHGFLLDGEGPFADPRATALPQGVFGLGQRVDHSAYTWEWTPPPWATAVVYELHVGTFTPGGTFASAIERLDHLVELGVTHVEVMPVHAAPGRRGWGYDPAGVYAVHPAYGPPESLKRFVEACHARGLAALLDVVYNHFGPAGAFAPVFGPYLHGRHQTPWGNALNFDGPDADEVRRFVCDNALMWLRDYHFDGLRLDAVHGMPDDSPRHVIAQLADEVQELAARLGRPLRLIAESDANDANLVRPRAVGGHGLDAVWSDDFHHALHAALTGERNWIFQDYGTLGDVAAVLRRGFLFAGQHSAFRQRPHGTPTDGLAPSSFVVCLQNHDQIGNRALGERLGHLIGPRPLKVAAALLLTSPFIPLLFQGEEWNASAPFLYFTDHEDPHLAQQVRDGRRAEFGDRGWNADEVPDPQAPETFARSVLNWDERTHGAHGEMLEWYRSLIRLRAQVPSLTTLPLDATSVDVDESARTLVLERGPLTVACNLATEPRRLPLDGAARVLLASDIEAGVEDGAVVLPPESVAMLRRG